MSESTASEALHGTVPIHTGMPVYNASQQVVGSLEEFSQDVIVVGGHRLPLDAVQHFTASAIYLRPGVLSDARSDAPAAHERSDVPEGPGTLETPMRPDARATDVRVAEGEVRVPVVQEQLVPEVRPVAVGDVTIHKYISSEEARLRQPVRHEEVEVQRVPVNRAVDVAPETRQEGEWLIVPVVEEQLVVQKRLLVKEEVRIRKRLLTEEHELSDTLRRERIEVEGPEGLIVERRPAE